MEKTKHTPGPWTIYTEPDTTFIKIERGPRSICKLPYYQSEENTANARLIAAAPELLEALEELVANFNWEKVPANEDQFDKMVARAEAAIRKAGGEQ